MPLPSACIPLTSSLRARVIEKYTPGGNSAPPSNPLDVSDIIKYLSRSRDTDASPLATIKRRASKDNRNADLRPEHHATLAWVCEAFDEWEEQYGIEAPLKDHARRLLPLTVAVALSDESFFLPGDHPLHLLLDALQNGAVGWQRRLDRAGQMLEQRVERSVERALEWFGNRSTDMVTITRELVAANERDAARAQRMVQRLTETEQARLKTISAKRDAALEINEGLARYRLPSAIGEFIKGPWYDSAQLVLMKYGEDSREWDQVSRATVHLMQSVQPDDADDQGDRDRKEQLLRHLPGQLRRWLLSLEHDSDETDGAIGLVEYAHLRIQHGQLLELIDIAPIELSDDELVDDEGDDEPLENGQWYRFEDSEGELRAQLVLQLENARHLLFANFVGLKALDLSRGAFLHRLNDGFAVALPSQDSFSISLASAAGIASEDDLRSFYDPSFTPASKSADTAPDASPDSPTPSSREDDTPPSASRDDVSDHDAPALQQAAAPRDAQEWSLSEIATAAPSTADTQTGYDSGIDPVLAPPEGAEVDSSLELELEETPLEPAPAAPTPAAAPTPPPISAPSPAAQPAPAPAPTPAPAPQQNVAAAQPFTDASAQAGTAPHPETSAVPHTAAVSSSPPAPPAEAAPSVPSSTTADVAPLPPGTQPSPMTDAAPVPREVAAPPPTASSAYAATEFPPPPTPATPVSPSPPPVTAAPQAPPASVLPQPGAPMSTAASAESAASTPPPPPSAPPPAAAAVEPPASGAEGAAAPTREIDVPMGAWLGFHDGETPIMAKLAVFDPRRDNYIFVNRKGIAMRELNRAELIALMDKGLVDILETRCYFRDEVERARGEDS